MSMRHDPQQPSTEGSGGTRDATDQTRSQFPDVRQLSRIDRPEDHDPSGGENGTKQYSGEEVQVATQLQSQANTVTPQSSTVESSTNVTSATEEDHGDEQAINDPDEDAAMNSDLDEDEDMDSFLSEDGEMSEDEDGSDDDMSEDEDPYIRRRRREPQPPTRIQPLRQTHRQD